MMQIFYLYLQLQPYELDNYKWYDRMINIIKNGRENPILNII